MPPLPWPGPAFGAFGSGPDQRASDADRETVVDMLCAAVGDGRLTLADLDERAEAVLSARTLTELAMLTADLPGRLPRPAPSRPDCPGCPGGRDAGGPDDLAAGRWALIRSLLAAA